MNKVQVTSFDSPNFDQVATCAFPDVPKTGNGIVVWVGVTVLGAVEEEVQTSVEDTFGHTYFRAASKWNPEGQVQASIWFVPMITRTGSTFEITAKVMPSGINAKPHIKAVELGELGVLGLDMDRWAQEVGNSNAPNTGITAPLLEPESFVAAATVIASQGGLTIQGPWTQEYEAGSFFVFPGEGDSRFTGKVAQQAIWTHGDAGPWAAVLATFSTKITPFIIRNLTGRVVQEGGAILCFIGPPWKSVAWRMIEGDGTLTPFLPFTDALGRASCRFDAAGPGRVVVGVAYIP